MKKLLLLCLFFTSCGFLSQPVGNKAVPEPIKAVEINQYLGKWYEVARFDNSFEKGCEGVSALYTKREDGLIDVLNSCLKEGKITTAQGKAKLVEGGKGAKLKVSFFGPFYGDYWVLDRGENYEWAIVGEPSGKYLWILTRQTKPANLNELIAKAVKMGYDEKLILRVKH
jgi:apolipoprotein D and lipocalin family protein